MIDCRPFSTTGLFISRPPLEDNALPVIVFPPLYGRVLMAWSKSPLLLYWVRLNSVRVSVLYWTTATRVLSSPMSKAPAREAMKLRMCLKFSLPTLHEPSTRKTKSAIALTEHSMKEKMENESKINKTHPVCISFNQGHCPEILY